MADVSTARQLLERIVEGPVLPLTDDEREMIADHFRAAEGGELSGATLEEVERLLRDRPLHAERR